MNDINKYLEILTEFAEKELANHFKIKKLGFEHFEIVNSYLIHQTICENRNNTLLYIPHKQTKSKFYIPVIFTLALYNFIDNFIDNETDFHKGDTLQLGKDRFVIEKIDAFNASLIKKDNANTRYPNVPKKKLKYYIKTYANASSAKVRKTFDSYRSFFKDYIVGIDREVPSQFKYKSIIVTDKSIVSELKAYHINGAQIHKAFPFQYVTKSGKLTNNIPIEPMIYVVNDYETVRQYILTQDITIRNITFIGKNKYEEHHLEITEDINNGKIENCLLIGSSDLSVNAIPNLRKWKWTLAELDYFNYFTTYPIRKIITDNNQFTIALNDFNNSIKQIEEEYGISLNELYNYIRNVIQIVIPTSRSRLVIQFDDLLIHFKKEGEDIVESILSEIGEYDYDDIWKEILDQFSKLMEIKKSSYLKFKEINKFQNIDYLVVPKKYLEFWENDIYPYKVKNVISFKDFKSKNLENKNKIIVFIGFYGYNHLKSMSYSSNEISILLSPEEDKYFNACQNKFNNETYMELKSTDRKAISNISFDDVKQIESIDELIDRLFSQDEEAKMNPDCSEFFTTNIVRELTFEDDTEKLVLDENKRVLLQIDQKEYFEKVKYLKSGDKIRVYDNSSKEELYQVALGYDVNGEFAKIEEFSKLWKLELELFYKEYNSLNELHQLLVKNGLSIKNPQTLNNWIRPESNVKFPQRRKDLLVLRDTLKSEILNGNYKDILYYRKVYNGLMIALGRDFSDEISEYIQHKKVGELLKKFGKKQIQQFVDQNAKERVIKTIKAINFEQ